jgi:hypothetical protein
MPRKLKTTEPFTIIDSGVRVRCYFAKGSWWTDRRDGQQRERKRMNVTTRSDAEAIAVAMCRELAVRSLTGAKPDTLTLGGLFRAYRRHKGGSLEGQWKRQAETHTRHFTDAWGESLLVATLSQTHIDAYSRARRAAFRELRKKKNPKAPTATLRDGALDNDFRWLSSVFNWATRHKVTGRQRLLDFNPLSDCTWPKERNVRRPVASHDRYLCTLAHTYSVDPRGRLRVALALARFTGRRVDAILTLRASDILLSADRVRSALAAAGMDEGQSQHMPNGAIRWRAESDKMGLLHISPISQAMREELERYMSANPRVGDVPLLPSDRDSAAPVRRFTATKWLLRAEKLAELPKLAGGLWHPYRRLWATERQSLSDVAVAAGGGWRSTKTLKVYQQIDPASVFAAISNGT